MPEPDKLQWRSDFGWSPYSPASSANPRSGLVIHYDSTDQGLADKSHAACVSYWKRTRAFHTGPSRGWADIGYSWGCCAHGYVMEGRGLFRTQAAQPGGNSTYYSCTLATGPNDAITSAQVNAVRQLREWLMEPQSSISGTVKGHRDFVSTSCPGEKAYDMVRDGTFRRAAKWGDDAPDEDERPAPDPDPPRPPVPGTDAPPFPLPSGHAFGPRTGPDWQVSGYYSHREDLRRWQRRMRDRGWVITPDGLYGDQTEGVTRAFQREKRLTVDGLIGGRTWSAAWTAPIT
ncbi:peptidoglycan recognition protein family protein [Nocardiopsis aegyptia]|uniref:Peptidoglycan hydrolase-like protein with peptidoglycan-binding domain n=1 Tax=Nocardiopsis aegyptia TaxID=220378 RepID=A0A7Z0JB50_9ACTN|nr:N-acetylmuramoyl-L-alanine amidase [Nocardiopsis aegyptia]NYJ35089.1 peptidoglycan hydrolase-like protein with peptidoglycan-binding domain [Nocardiopsis aegyptia]